MIFPVDIWYDMITRSSLLSVWDLSLSGPVCNATGLAELNTGYDGNGEVSDPNCPAELDGR